MTSGRRPAVSGKLAAMSFNTPCFLLALFLSFASTLVLCAPGRSGQVSPDEIHNEVYMDDVSAQLAKEIAKAHLRSAVVADFLSADGKSSDLGWYLAAKFSQSWEQRQQEFRLLDRSELTDTKVTADDVRSGDVIKRLGQMWGVDAIVTGSVGISADQYLLTTSVLWVSDGATIATASKAIPHYRILDLLSPQGLGDDGQAQSQGGVNGAGVPACTFCPTPGYSDKASRAKLQANVVLTVTISRDGQAARIRIAKDAGYGLTEKAIEDVSQWKFRPATNKEGQPIPVVVPVEVTFRMGPG
jgi:TonB family protein